jgi:hypothetical protein
VWDSRGRVSHTSARVSHVWARESYRRPSLVAA